MNEGPGINHSVVKIFFDGWAIYDEVLRRNYMFHDELFEEVGRTLEKLFGSKPFSVIDLGCGSARHFSAALRGRNVRRYVGYDLSEVALEHAGRNLAGLNCPVELRRGDLFAGLNDEPSEVDLIFSSFAVHHLSSSDKAVFFARAHRRLKPDGRLLLIDITREEGEDRATCLDRYCKWMETDWSTLPAQGLVSACDHIRTYDFPEMNSTMRRMAADAGFVECKDLCDFRGHREWLFS